MSNNSNNQGDGSTKSNSMFSGFPGISGITSRLGNLLNTSSPPPESPPSPDNKQEDDSFKYSIGMPEKFPLKTKFDDLAMAINAKKKILENYKDLNDILILLNKSLDEYITKHTDTASELTVLQETNKGLQKKVTEIENKPSKNSADQETIDRLNAQITENAAAMLDLTETQNNNSTNLQNIGKLIDEATIEINNKMYPLNDTDITDIKKLIKTMKDKLGNDSSTTTSSRISESNDVDAYNPFGYDVLDNKSSADFKGANPMKKGGYRYSSSQMRRKSTAKRSSASGSSSSKRRRNKKRTAKKMMLGGKRMKKTKSTKRKNHKKC